MDTATSAILFEIFCVVCVVGAIHYMDDYITNKRLFFFSLLASTLALISLSLIHIFSYILLALVLIMFARSATKELDHPSHGNIMMGLYFGFWMSLPAAGYSVAS